MTLSGHVDSWRMTLFVESTALLLLLLLREAVVITYNVLLLDCAGPNLISDIIRCQINARSRGQNCGPALSAALRAICNMA